MIEIPALEYHLAHGCNLSCQQCSHYSNFHVAGKMPTPEESRIEYEHWNHRVLPKRFALLGGEPLLNPDLIKHLHTARHCWPHSSLMLVTNGFFLGRHSGLPDTLLEIGCRLEVSQHGTAGNYLKQFRKVKQTVWRWREQYPGIQIKIRQSHKGWMKQYKVVDGKPIPFNSKPAAAYRVCMQKTCTQLFDGKLWKCPAIAYWDQIEKRLNLQDASNWQLFRNYQPCSPNSTQAELEAFLTTKHIPQCALCPASRTHHQHPDPTMPDP